MNESNDQHHEPQELKHYLAFVELLRHTLAASTPKQTPRPRWQVILESTGGTALITVIVGGIVAGTVGQYLTYRYQQSLRQREVATATYEAYLKRADETITHSFSLIGQVMSASDDMIRLAYPIWNPERYPLSTRPRIIADRTKLIEGFREARHSWAKERDQQTLLLQFHHNADPEVAKTWNNLQNSVTAYSDCANQLFWRRGVREERSLSVVSCIGERQVLLTNIDRFTLARIVAARKQASLAMQEK